MVGEGDPLVTRSINRKLYFRSLIPIIAEVVAIPKGCGLLDRRELIWKGIAWFTFFAHNICVQLKSYRVR